MAKSREYAYYVKGGKINLVEKSRSGADGLNYTHNEGDGLDLPSGTGAWKSPVDTVEDGIRIEYAYSPKYRISDSSAIGGTVYESDSGLLKITIPATTITEGDYIVIANSEKWNGLHQVNASSVGTTVVLKTKYTGGSVSESFSLYTSVNVLDNEEDELDIPEYLCKAVVDYLKAKLAEDTGEVEAKEYFMVEFRRKIEKYESARLAGPRMIVPGIKWQ